MVRWCLWLGRGIPVLALSALLSGCYDVPQPSCGFRCGPDGACPEGYTCSAADGRCHLDGSPASLVCGMLDGPPVDASIDAADAQIDAM